MSGMILKCRRCGHDMPPLGDEEQATFLAGGSSAAAEHAPGQCPHELAAAAALAAAAPVRRRFRATMILEELFEEDEEHPSHTDVLGQFGAEIDATTPGVAFEPGGPLANDLGEKWARLAPMLNLADVPAEPDDPDVVLVDEDRLPEAP